MFGAITPCSEQEDAWGRALERSWAPLPDYKISFEVQSLLNVFSKTVFRTPEDVLRELLTNAQDACILRKAQDPKFVEPLINVSADERERVLNVADNGIGMTEDICVITLQ